MLVDFVGIAHAAVTLVAPFLPHLVSFGGSLEKKIQDKIAEKAVGAGWSKAEALWAKVTESVGHDDEVIDAAKMVARAPEDSGRQQTLTEVLAARLNADPKLTQELLTMMGGPEGVQRVIGGNEAKIEDIRQKMASTGKQSAEGGDKAELRRISQEMGD